MNPGPIAADRLKSFIVRGLRAYRARPRLAEIDQEIAALTRQAMRECNITKSDLDLARVRWREEHGRNRDGGRVYFAKIVDEDVVKIGFSEFVESRIKQLRSNIKRPLELIGTVDGDRLYEKVIHHQFREHHLGSELFVWSPIRDAALSMIARNSGVLP